MRKLKIASNYLKDIMTRTLHGCHGDVECFVIINNGAASFFLFLGARGGRQNTTLLNSDYDDTSVGGPEVCSTGEFGI